ncbi:MAG: TolC family protein, partial [Candidatus Neomarinimicrobiota bacterium]
LVPTFTPQPEYLEMAFGLENVLIAGIQLQQPIYLGGTIRNGYNISKLGYNIAQLQFKSIEQNVLNELTSSYYRVLFTKSTLTVFQEALQSAEQNLEQVNKFYNVGKASNFDLLRAEVQVANTKPFVASAKNNFRLSESGLRMIMGIDESIELNFVEELELYYSELTIKSLEELMEIALISRPEIQMLNDQKSITKKQVSLSKASFLPTVVFGTSYQYQGMRNDLNFNSEDFNKSFNSSISISVPLFSGMKNSAKYQQAKIAVKETEHQAESLINSIKLEVKSAYYTMQEALEKVQTQQKTIEQAKEAQRLAHLMYSEGSSTQLDILNADLAVQQAQMNYQQSLFEYNVALANLKKAINQL